MSLRKFSRKSLGQSLWKLLGKLLGKSLGKVFGNSLRKSSLLSAFAVIFCSAPLFAGSFFIGGGAIQRFIPGDGTIRWAPIPGQGTIDGEGKEVFDVANPMTFLQLISFPSGRVNGLGWDSRRSSAVKALLGYRFNKRFEVTLSAQLPFSRETIHRESGFAGPTLIHSDLISRYRQSAIALEARLYPIGESAFFSVGVERTSSSLQFISIELIPILRTGEVFEYPLGKSKTAIQPIVGVGYEYYFLDFLGVVAHATYSFTTFDTFGDTAPVGAGLQDPIFEAEFDNGGLGISLSTVFRPKFKR